MRTHSGGSTAGLVRRNQTSMHSRVPRRSCTIERRRARQWPRSFALETVRSGSSTTSTGRVSVSSVPFARTNRTGFSKADLIAYLFRASGRKLWRKDIDKLARAAGVPTSDPLQRRTLYEFPLRDVRLLIAEFWRQQALPHAVSKRARRERNRGTATPAEALGSEDSSIPEP